ncbi:MAG: PEP-CTERM sorting domain-containing protein [Planctomycetes bacterium]|jgi:hypothetical protein|nr:PEP-CTERM sorting domain-containing protein [Planctomycetota bacterium]
MTSVATDAMLFRTANAQLFEENLNRQSPGPCGAAGARNPKEDLTAKLLSSSFDVLHAQEETMMKNLLTLKTLVAVAAVLMVGSIAPADTIQEIIDGGNSVTYDNLVFSDFSVSGATDSLAGVNAGNVDVNFVVSGEQVTLEFSPNESYGSAWTNSALSFGGSFVVNYIVTAINADEIDATGMGLDSATASATSYAKAASDLYADAGGTQLAGQTSVQTGMASLFGSEKLSGYSSFNPSEDVLYAESTVSVLAMNGTSAGIGQFSQSYEAVPEPGTLGVMGIGALGMMIARRRKGRKTA